MAKNGSRRPVAEVLLSFKDERAFRTVDDPIHKDLSALARLDDSLFASCDETAGIDRLTPGREGWGNHRHFGLGAIFDLPGGEDGEMDIEGLDCDSGWLWVMGSQSLTRGKPEKDAQPGAALVAMTGTGMDANRQFIGRVPLERTADGWEPVAEGEAGDAAALKFTRGGKLRRWLKGDDLIGPFLGIPSKENGLDLEGIAAKGDRVWLGLRGPVLREMAVILELDLKVTKSGHLKARRIAGRRRYRRHLVPTGGEGVRDLKFDGDDLLILTGPVTAGDGRADILRWRDAATCETEGVRGADEVRRVVELPYRGARDHPEGLVHWPEEGEDTWLVVHDSPADARLKEEGQLKSVTGDVWRL